MRSLPLAAVLVLFVNDHVLKHAYPGFVTGKLSDIAGMIFFPVLLHAVVSMMLPASQLRGRRSEQLLVVACVATAVVFALTKTSVLANEAYRVTWGALYWPLRAARALLLGHALPPLTRVLFVRDASDLLAAPFVLLAWTSGRAARSLEAASPTASSSASADRLHRSTPIAP